MSYEVASTLGAGQLSGLYQGGPAAFFTDWQEFTESATPLTLSKTPRLVLVARDFDGRTESAMEFLIENGLPVEVIAVSIYEDQAGRRFLDVGSDYEPELGGRAILVVLHGRLRGVGGCSSFRCPGPLRER